MAQEVKALRDPRRVVLAALRDMSHRQIGKSEILTLEVPTVAGESGVPANQLSAALSDLLAEGLVEGYAETMGQSAVQGSCRITGEGLRELREMERRD